MDRQGQDANDHRSKAQHYLVQAQQATDPETRQELLALCEQELIKAVTARHSEREPGLIPRTDRRKVTRRSSDNF